MTQPPTPAGAIAGLAPDAFSSMFQSINALRNRRALIAMLGCLLVGVLLAGLFTSMAARMGFFFALLAAVSLFVAGCTAVNAAGVLLMDQARGMPLRPLSDAVVYGVMCIPKVIVLYLGLLLVAVAMFVALAIVYFVCKIPYLGAFLFTFVFPLSVVVSGLTLCGLSLCSVLALPAIWEGATIGRAIAQALAIARSRLVESILLLAVVWVLAVVVGGIVFAILFSGLMPTLALSASILGGDVMGSMMGLVHGAGAQFGGMGGGGFGDPGGGFGGGRVAPGGGGAGHLIAAGIGAGMLWALVGSMLALVYLLGLNLVYLRVTEGLDVSATEAALKARFDEAKRQAADLGQKAKEAADRAREQARQAAAAAQAAAARPAPPAPQPPPSPADDTTVIASYRTSGVPAPEPPSAPYVAPAAKTAACPQCLAPVGTQDVFCGVCGHRLK